MKRVGAVAIIVGGAGLVAGTLLQAYGDDDRSLWDFVTFLPLVFSVLAGLTICSAVASLVVNRPGLLVPPLPIAAFLLGENLPLTSVAADSYAVGSWGLVAGSVLMTAGSTLLVASLIGSLRSTPTTAADARAARVPRANPSIGTFDAADYVRAPAELPTPPAGWYPDPAGRARERLWSGEAWTEHARN